MYISVCVCVPTTGEELRPDGGHELPLKRLWVGAFGVLDCNVLLFDPAQQPQKVAVTQQVRRLKFPVNLWKGAKLSDEALTIIESCDKKLLA